ncbi:hypothetical protein GCM10009665_37030 [Kitasatospora nipponensis]|uniref:MYXO-CTERM domain-containing protein n=1 Tax=Kitasatospora nipponensis TaxID=258049 RepID=A0ABP4GXN0_9ACTN
MRARHLAGAGALTAALALALAGPALANPVVIEPDPVTPGGQFTVLDGGNCDSAGGTATFRSREHDGEDIPAVRLGSLRGLVGAVATVPERARPGTYEVSIQCTTVTKSQVTTTLTVYGDAKPDAKGAAKPDATGDAKGDAKPDAKGDPKPDAKGDGHGGAKPSAQPAASSAPAVQLPTAVGPQGPSHAGLGGSTGPNTPETLAGITLLGTAAAATVHHLRRRRTR